MSSGRRLWLALAGVLLVLAVITGPVGSYSPFKKGPQHGSFTRTSPAVNGERGTVREREREREREQERLATPYVGPLVGLEGGGKRAANDFLEDVGKNVFDTVYHWKVIDFMYPSLQLRNNAIRTREFIPENNLPLGVDRFRDRLFITTPRWNPGVPATLSYLPLPAQDRSQPLMPYPDWSYHTSPRNPDCSKMMSVYRIQVDECDRLWVLDAGVTDTLTNLQQVCPPKIMAFDLQNDELLFTYVLPEEQVKEDSLHTNIVVDVRDGQCDDAFAYVADVWRNGITVFDMRKFKSWRTTNHLYNPNPLASDYNYQELNFQWSDGVFGMSLAPVHRSGDRMLLFHPMSSFMEFQVPASILRNETVWEGFGLAAKAFQPVGTRGRMGQSSTAGVGKNNVQFFTLVQQSGVGCWDLGKPYNRNNLGVVEKNAQKLTFPNDLKVDREPQQSLWVMSNKLPVFLYDKLDYTQTNFRVLMADARKAIENTVCDPRVPPSLAFDAAQLECELEL
ncbi:protein yellow-like [Anopheles stephensi]|uniref:Bee-milk protein n=1 Tax=Anopheles stephensi TaxID=30069 RepID=A0A182XZ21_ANOST|nr:protein yellow-like [Anopheles stephensi]XP_035912052.1 protein yellow-like [Anopheles stephensi]XP_035912053.1 protein yellow-like [Anopheles stephensi]